jgi:hypothetical protein
LSKLQAVAASPTICVLIVKANEISGNTVAGGEGKARIACLDGVDVAGSILLRLGGQVWKGASTATDVLVDSKSRAEVLLGVVFVKVGRGHAASLG